MTSSSKRETKTDTFPPLFLAGYSSEGLHEDVMRIHEEPPRWLDQAAVVRITAPSGVTVDVDMRAEQFNPMSYADVLEKLGAENLWVSSVKRPDNILSRAQVWAPDEAHARARAEGPLLSVEWSNDTLIQHPPFYAIVHNTKSSAYVANGGIFYFDLIQREIDVDLVPRAILDTGLAGAFWSYNDHSNSRASYLTARRLLEQVFQTDSFSALDIIAAAQAVVVNHTQFSEFRYPAVEYLANIDGYQTDKAILQALLSMTNLYDAQDQDHKSAGAERVAADIYGAFEAVAKWGRPVFGETLRLLNSRLSTMTDIARYREHTYGFDRLLPEVGKMLRCSYAGGHSATYVGKPEIMEDSHWRAIYPLSGGSLAFSAE